MGINRRAAVLLRDEPELKPWEKKAALRVSKLAVRSSWPGKKCNYTNLIHQQFKSTFDLAKHICTRSALCGRFLQHFSSGLRPVLAFGLTSCFSIFVNYIIFQKLFRGFTWLSSALHGLLCSTQESERCIKGTSLPSKLCFVPLEAFQTLCQEDLIIFLTDQGMAPLTFSVRWAKLAVVKTVI